MGAYESPIAIADLDGDGILSAGDGSLYAVFDAALFSPFADAENFALGSIWETDAAGQVWDGMTFYADEALTTPYANGRIIVQAISGDIPGPSVLAMFALAGVCARRRR